MTRRQLFSLLPFSVVGEAHQTDPVVAAWNQFAHEARTWAALRDSRTQWTVADGEYTQWVDHLAPAFHRVDRLVWEERRDQR